MDQQKSHCPETTSTKHRNPMTVALLAVAFTFPFCTGDVPLQYLFFTAYFVFFIVYVFFYTRKYRFSLLAELKQHHRFLFYLFFAFGISSLVSYAGVMFSDVGDLHKAITSGRYLMYLVTMVYVFAVARYCLVNEVSHSQIFFWYMLGTLVLILLLLLVYHFGGAPNAANWAVQPPFGAHVRYMGMTAAVAVIVCVILFLFNAPTFSRQLFFWLCLLVCSAFLIWTGSRTSMFLAVLTTFLLMLLGRMYRKTAYAKMGVLLACIFLSVLAADKVSIFPWSGLERSIKVSVVEDTELAKPQNSAYELTDKLSSGRMFIWHTVFNAAMESPWFGLGPNATLFLFKPPRVYDQPHSFILQFLVEWGLVGASLLLAILAYLAWQGWKNIPQAIRQGDTDFLIPASVVFLLTLNGLTDGVYYHIQPLFCLGMAFAVFPFFGRSEKAAFTAKVMHK